MRVSFNVNYYLVWAHDTRIHEMKYIEMFIYFLLNELHASYWDDTGHDISFAILQWFMLLVPKFDKFMYKLNVFA